MTLRILSNSTINKIAAGEVIARPASVVKELVENAIDAGATKIKIVLERAGKNLIIISDNGSGMTKEELVLAIQRHATSKLDEEDLLNINSFGFRGEALPSIGAISKFKITSKKRDINKAHTLSIIGGIQESVEVDVGMDGTRIEVRDLFFVTPARLKFLRTDRTELNASIDVVKKIALSHPNITFNLVHDDREILNFKAGSGNFEESLKQRINDVIGSAFIQNATKVYFKDKEIEIYGYCSLPTFNRSSSEDQFLFINNRPVKDKILNVALKVAYQDFLARNRYCVCTLFLSINPQLVDVNVHPAKTEVRFHDSTIIRGMFINAIKEGLLKSSHRVSSTIATAAINYINNSSKQQQSFNNNSISSKNSKFNIPYSNINRVTTPRIDYSLANFQSLQKLIETHPVSRIEIEEKGISEVKNYPLGSARAQLHETYIISQTEDSIIIIDQHAAHERLGYEKIKLQIDKNGLIKQRLLIPEIVELPDNKRAEILEENKENISQFGLTLEKFGDRSIIVSEIPSLIGKVNVTNLIQDLADHFISMGEKTALTELIEHVTETYACHYAIRAGKKLSASEMNELLRQMENTPFSGQCNHGRPTYVELKLKDIEKLFGRR